MLLLLVAVTLGISDKVEAVSQKVEKRDWRQGENKAKKAIVERLVRRWDLQTQSVSSKHFALLSVEYLGFIDRFFEKHEKNPDPRLSAMSHEEMLTRLIGLRELFQQLSAIQSKKFVLRSMEDAVASSNLFQRGLLASNRRQ